MIDDRSDELINIVNKQLAQEPVEDSSVDVAFNTHDFQKLLVLLETFGSVHTTSLDREILGNDDLVDNNSATAAAKNSEKEEEFDESVFAQLKGITFSIKTGIRYLTHSLLLTRSYSLAYSLTYSLTHLLTHSLTYSLLVVYMTS